MRTPHLIVFALLAFGFACSKDPAKPASSSGSGSASSARPERGGAAAESKDAAPTPVAAIDAAPPAPAPDEPAPKDTPPPPPKKNPLDKIPKPTLPDRGPPATAPDAGAKQSSNAASAPGRGQDCGPNDTCASGLQCIIYYGVAGPRGPKFTSCETPCTGGKGCPKGTSCMTIADGPGQVCR